MTQPKIVLVLDIVCVFQRTHVVSEYVPIAHRSFFLNPLLQTLQVRSFFMKSPFRPRRRFDTRDARAGG